MEKLLYRIFNYLYEGQPWQIEKVKYILSNYKDTVDAELEAERMMWDGETPAMRWLKEFRATIQQELDAEAEDFLTSHDDK